MIPQIRTVSLDDWRAERARWPGAASTALFLNARGGRLFVRGAYDILTGLVEQDNLEVGRDADFTPHRPVTVRRNSDDPRRRGHRYRRGDPWP
jgi:hypothetical protein